MLMRQRPRQVFLSSHSEFALREVTAVCVRRSSAVYRETCFVTCLYREYGHQAECFPLCRYLPQHGLNSDYSDVFVFAYTV